MEQPRGGKAAGRAGVIKSLQKLPAMNRKPSAFPEPITCRGRMIRIDRSRRYGQGVSDASTHRESARAWMQREEQRRKSAQHAVSKTSAQSGNTVALVARRRAPCKVRSGCRRRGVPRLLLWWRCAGSTISGMRNHSSVKRRARMPNPSLKRSANGRPRWPSSAGASPHFALAVQRVLPSSPA